MAGTGEEEGEEGEEEEGEGEGEGEEAMAVAQLSGCLDMPLRPVVDASEEIMLLWALGQPQSSPQNAFVRQSQGSARIDACGHNMRIFQTPSALNKPGVTGAVLWDSAIMLGKFLEHSHDSRLLSLKGKRCIELGAGCGFVGCVAAFLGGEVILTDLPDRLRLLQKNVDENTGMVNLKAVPSVRELTWGEEVDTTLLSPQVDFVLASDVVYNEKAIDELLYTLMCICSGSTLVILSGELRNDAILELFLESALKDFHIWRVPQTQWHPDFSSQRVVLYVMKKRLPETE